MAAPTHAPTITQSGDHQTESGVSKISPITPVKANRVSTPRNTELAVDSGVESRSFSRFSVTRNPAWARKAASALIKKGTSAPSTRSGTPSPQATLITAPAFSINSQTSA